MTLGCFVTLSGQQELRSGSTTEYFELEPPLYDLRMLDWSQYQERVADLFRSVGLSAETNVRLTGTRTTHDVDVVVKGSLAGLTVTWLVECKYWKSRIPKKEVFTLRTIVDDTGSDRGFIMAESGYQSGALAASCYTNVLLTSIEDLNETLAPEIGKVLLHSILDRVTSCRKRYWQISKEDRIEFGLRPDSMALGYRSTAVLDVVEFFAREALLHGFPVRYNSDIELCYESMRHWRSLPESDTVRGIQAPAELYEVLNLEFSALEERLDYAEGKLGER